MGIDLALINRDLAAAPVRSGDLSGVRSLSGLTRRGPAVTLVYNPEKNCGDHMFSGVHVPLITPFNGGQVDFDSHDRLIDHLLGERPNGLVMFGTTGERLLISDQEALTLARRTISAVSGTLPLTLAVGALATQEVVNQVRLFEDLEPAAYLVGSPFYVRPSQEDLIRHHATVATATERPVLLYNIPFRSGVNLTNESILELATIDNVLGIKDVCGDLEQTFALLRLKPDNFAVLAGQDPHYFASLAHGADGGVLASAHFHTRDFCHMTDLLRGGALGPVLTSVTERPRLPQHLV